VEVFESLEKLVDDVLFVDFLKDLGSDDMVKIGFHEIED